MRPFPNIDANDLVLPQGGQGAGQGDNQGEDDQCSPDCSFGYFSVEEHQWGGTGQPWENMSVGQNLPSMILWVDNQKVSFNDDQEKPIGEANLKYGITMLQVFVFVFVLRKCICVFWEEKTHSAAGCQEKKKGNELHVGVAVNLFFYSFP